MAFLHPFFIFFLCYTAHAEVPASLNDALRMAQNLEIHKSREMLKAGGDKQHPVYYLVEDYNDILELIIDEDPERFDAFEEKMEKRVEKVEKLEGHEKWKKLVLGEIKFHWAIVNFKYNNEITAAWNLNQAHSLIKDNQKKYPDFLPNLKTMGIFHIVVGALPNNYQWVLEKLGFKGDINLGLKEMEQVSLNNNIFKYESTLLLTYIRAQLFGEYSKSIQKLTSLYHNSKSLSANYLLVSLLTNSNNAETAIKYITERNQTENHPRFDFYHYKLANCYFQKAEYTMAIREFNAFIKGYKGKNYLKGAYHKIALAYYFQHDKEQQQKAFDMIGEVGWELGDEDKYAQKFYEKRVFPNIVLSKARYLSDGGYYKTALQLLTSKNENSFDRDSEKVEYCYRKARIYDLMKSQPQAVSWYEKTIEESKKLKQDQLYFAPNACLKLAVIYLDQEKKDDAEKRLKEAISYKNHEYENSIEMKSKSLLKKIEG